VIRTGGGAFDPTDRRIYFPATFPKMLSDKVMAGDEFSLPAVHPHVLVATNDIEDPADLEALIDLGYKVFLDSGVFFMTNQHMRRHGITMDEALALPPSAIDGFDELFERYVRLCTTYGEHLWGYVEVDQGGAENKRITRARLHDLGLQPIPVYHPLNDGREYFDELAESHDRICYGNIVQADAYTRERLLLAAWDMHREYPDLWIHLLGLTPNQHLHAAWPDSCDSSSWLTMLRWSASAREKAMLRTITGGFDPEWIYELGNSDQLVKQRQACAVYAHWMQLVWRQFRSECEEHLQ
jgi:hypothetical protein